MTSFYPRGLWQTLVLSVETKSNSVILIGWFFFFSLEVENNKHSFSSSWFFLFSFSLCVCVSVLQNISTPGTFCGVTGLIHRSWTLLKLQRHRGFEIRTSWPTTTDIFPVSSKHSSIVSIAACSWFASALFVAWLWPGVRSVRRREQPPSVCLPGWADTVAAAQTADSCISLASSICYLETSDFITADQCSCTLWLSPGLSALSVSPCSCQSFSWAVSNWILAGLLIVRCASFLPPSWHQSSICLSLTGTCPPSGGGIYIKYTRYR